MKLTILRRGVVAAAVVAGSLIASGPAMAHTELVSASPAEGEVVVGPVSEITLVFSESVAPAGNGFEVFDPSGTTLQPPVETTDSVTFVLRLDPPLPAGEIGVRYEVTSDDGHVVTGAYAFTVEAPPETTTTATPTTITPSTATSAPPDSTVAPTTAAPDPTATTAAPTTITTPTTTAVDAPGADDGSNTTLIVAVILVVVLGGAAAAFVWARSRRGDGGAPIEP